MKKSSGCIGCLGVGILVFMAMVFLATPPESARRADAPAPQAPAAPPEATPPQPEPVASAPKQEAAPAPAPIPVPEPAAPPVEPNWDDRRAHWQSTLYPEFAPPKMGVVGNLKLTNGEFQKGSLVDLDGDSVTLRLENGGTLKIMRDRIAPDRRPVFFRKDWLAQRVNEELQREKGSYQTALETHRQEQERRRVAGELVEKNLRLANLRIDSLLALESWSWKTEHGYAIAEGEVTNLTKRNLQNVAALVTFRTANDTYITSEESLIDYNPILPGQTSPFKVIVTANPEMAKATISFIKYRGGTIPFATRAQLEGRE